MIMTDNRYKRKLRLRPLSFRAFHIKLKCSSSPSLTLKIERIAFTSDTFSTVLRTLQFYSSKRSHQSYSSSTLFLIRKTLSTSSMFLKKHYPHHSEKPNCLKPGTKITFWINNRELLRHSRERHRVRKTFSFGSKQRIHSSYKVGHQKHPRTSKVNRLEFWD